MTANDDTLHFDLVVIGGGSGGLAAAFRAASHGARVALVEPAELGGTCVNVGCVPKKAMWLAADLVERIALARDIGFPLPPCLPHWDELVAHRQRYIANIHASYRERLDAAGIVQVVGRARLCGGGIVETCEGVRLHGRHVLLATGARPHRPDMPGAELGLVSDDFFAFDAAPRRVAIIGGGYIGVELSAILQALGSHVEVFVRGPRLLEGFEHEITEQLQENYRQRGLGLHLGYTLEALESVDGGVALRERGGDLGNPFDVVLFATGRRANIAGLGLDAAGVRTDDRGRIVVDRWQDTSAAGVHAVGDVTDGVALTPVAIAAARRLMDRLFGGDADACLDASQVPTVVFAHPPLASVGLTEAQARERFGDDVSCQRTRFRPMLFALAESPQCSLFKLVCTGPEQRVVGLHLVGEGADEMLQGFAVAMRLGATLADLQATIALHPTSAEEVVLMG